ncbi:MAG: hypothetical protein IT299_13195 [Dehalococcoidia bacterium]|nr:hypothetical protein [Dehalococcoidia bacterium]
MSGLLHVICAGVRPDATEAQRAATRALAEGLGAAPGVRGVLVAESATHLLVATWLGGRDSLEAFAASPPHMAFIMRGVAAVTSGMWSAAVETESDPPSEAARLLVFGLRSSEGAPLYEWQVRALLDELATLPGACAGGPTFEERDRFRAAGCIAIPADAEGFEAALAGLESVRALGAPFVSAIAPVIASRVAG